MHFTPEEAAVAAGATAAELAEFADRGLLVPKTRRWLVWGRREIYYTATQIEILRWLIKTRRVRQGRGSGSLSLQARSGLEAGSLSNETATPDI